MNATITEPVTQSTAPRLSRPVQQALLMAGILGVNVVANNSALAQSSGMTGITMPSVSGCTTVDNPFYSNTGFDGFSSGGVAVTVLGFTNLLACAETPLTTTFTTVIQGFTLIFIPTATAAAPSPQSVPINSAPALIGLAAALAFSARRIRRRNGSERAA